MMSKKKESMGRQRIPMVKIKKETHRQVTFSKPSNPYWTVTCPETICP
ncbi:BnaA09g41190D [Brassica napus]|uniref:BnaA09g41190D protein n=1 Tax=Brassica napus TaxID=3708 RepID=A0A078CL78_BRANA|nr:BnaA09g41190D [Brassica napus]